MVIPESNHLVIFFLQNTPLNRKNRNSAITRVLLDKKSIRGQFWRFTFFDIGDCFFQNTPLNRKNRNSTITRVLLDKNLIRGQFWRFTFFDIGDFFSSKYFFKS